MIMTTDKNNDYYSLPLSFQQECEPRRFRNLFPHGNNNKNGAKVDQNTDSDDMNEPNDTVVPTGKRCGFGFPFETHHHEKRYTSAMMYSTATAATIVNGSNYAKKPTGEEQRWELDEQRHAAPMLDHVALMNGMADTRMPNNGNNGFLSIGNPQQNFQKISNAAIVDHTAATSAIPNGMDGSIVPTGINGFGNGGGTQNEKHDSDAMENYIVAASTIMDGMADTVMPTFSDQQQQSELDMEFERRARQMLDEAIQGVPEVETSAYSEALRRAPHLVETESDPMCFLRFEKLNAWEAAFRIVAYWEERKKAFGPNRYLLPLTLTGKSALTPEAIRELRLGTSLMLPKDQSGRSVVYCNQDRFRQLGLDVCFQLVFYGYFMAMRNELSQSEGMVLIYHKFNEKNTRDIFKVTRVLRSVMPVHNHSIHIITPSAIDPIRLHLAMWFTNQKAFVHLCHTPEERAANLLPFGFSKDRLPSFLGGSWEVVQWDGVGQDHVVNWLASNSDSNSNNNSLDKGNNDVVRDNHNLLSFRNCSESGNVLSLGSCDVQNDNTFMPNHEPEMTVTTCFGTQDSNASREHIGKQEETLKTESASRLLVAGKKSQPIPNRNKRRQNILDKNNVQPGVCQPHDTDVLFGKGKKCCHHPGNKVFRALIERHSKQYDESRSTSQKVRIRRSVFEYIRQSGSRFLKFNQKKGEWAEVVEEIADNKIAQTLRNFRQGRLEYSRKFSK